jgi:UDP-glucose 4-epimerase
MRRVALVTGGAGFIGSHLTDRLTAEGVRVRVLDDFSTGSRDNLTNLPGDADVIEGDLLDPRALRRALAGVDVVFHHAALVSVPSSVAEPVRTHEVNASGTLFLLVASREAGVGRVVYAGSSAAYGEAAGGRIAETAPVAPTSPYGAAKLAGELYCRAFTASYGLPTVALRYFNVFGSRQDPGSGYAAVIPAFATALLQGRAPVVYGDGRQSRDFVHVRDVAHANVLAWRAPDAAVGRVFNVGSGHAHSLLELLETLRGVTGVDALEPVFEPPRAGDIRHSRSDITQAARSLSFGPLVSFRDGLEETVAALRSRIAAP